MPVDAAFTFELCVLLPSAGRLQSLIRVTTHTAAEDVARQEKDMLDDWVVLHYNTYTMIFQVFSIMELFHDDYS